MNGPAISPDLTTINILVGGIEVPTSLDIISISVTKKFNKIPSAQIILSDGDLAKQDFEISNKDFFKPGAEIQIEAGYHSENSTIFRGFIIEHGIKSRGNSKSRLIVKCKDKAFLLAQKQTNKLYKNSSDTDAIKEILDSYGINNTVDSTDTIHGSLVKYHTTDWDFIVSRAEKNELFVNVDDGEISIQKPDLNQSPVLELTYGDNISELELNIDSRSQVKDVSSSSWSISDQAVISEDAPPFEFEEPGNLLATELADFAAAEVSELRHSGLIPEEELRSWAKSKIQLSRLSKIQGRVQIQGEGAVKPGNLVQISGAGDRFNGNHLVTAVQHQISLSDWETNIQLGTSRNWYTDNSNLRTSPAEGLLSAINGLQIGVVSQLQEDPMGEHRILVKLPLVDSQDEGLWARVANPDAGENRGIYFRPELGDEVIVGFINDDPRNPVVLGMLHSSAKPAPLEELDSNHEKGIITRGELKLKFNDENKSITVSTPSGKELIMDENEDNIKIKDDHGNYIEMNSNGITISSSGEILIKTPSDIKMNALNLTAKADSHFKAEGGSTMELKSNGNTIVKGAIVKIN